MSDMSGSSLLVTTLLLRGIESPSLAWISRGILIWRRLLTSIEDMSFPLVVYAAV